MRIPSLPDEAAVDPRRLLPSPTAERDGIPVEKWEAAKATYTASGGNVSQVAAMHDLTHQKVARLAAKHEWPVYGDGLAASDKSRKVRLERLYVALERQVFDMLESLDVETKDPEEFADKQKWSQYVASLSQRSSAFSALFDRYMRVAALVEPELFAGDDDPSNTTAAKIRRRSHEDALGGVDGINRQLADFAARVAVGVVDGMSKRPVESGEVIDVEPADD